MHVISKVKLREFWVQHADSEDALNDWYKFASIANWSSLLDVQKRYPKAEAVGNFTVFNIKGNNYRLISASRTLVQSSPQGYSPWQTLLLIVMS
jgi:mRNA interferase HigB